MLNNNLFYEKQKSLQTPGKVNNNLLSTSFYQRTKLKKQQLTIKHNTQN